MTVSARKGAKDLFDYESSLGSSDPKGVGVSVEAEGSDSAFLSTSVQPRAQPG